MKHRLTVPYLDGATPDVDVTGWARLHGWHVTEYSFNDRLAAFASRTILTVTLVPCPGAFPDHGAKVTACSGATLIYDDTDRSMAVTLQSEPQDAIPEDARRMRT